MFGIYDNDYSINVRLENGFSNKSWGQKMPQVMIYICHTNIHTGILEY